MTPTVTPMDGALALLTAVPQTGCAVVIPNLLVRALKGEGA